MKPYQWNCIQKDGEIVSIPLHLKAENTQIEVKVGDIGYWMDGDAFVIFFGPTPHSTNDTPRAASDINIFAKIEGDPDVSVNLKTFMLL